MADPVADSWQRIVRWLNAHAPATAAQVRGPGDPALVDALERDVGVALPADLRAWWARTDGFQRGAVEALLPHMHVPLPVADAREDRRTWLRIEAGVAHEDSAGEDELAGSFSHRFRPVFVPISTDNCGQLLFVDLRPGPRHGCVCEWDHEEGFLKPPHWPGVAAMLAETADALATGGPALTEHHERLRATGHRREGRAWASVTADGELEWTTEPLS
jgi:cell wall assembly regulator SMI1